MAEEKKISLVLLEDILKEFAEVLNYKEIQDKVREKNLEMKRTLAKIISISSIVEPKQKFDVCKDPKDNMVLECAFEGKADYIVTQDKHLLQLCEFKGIKIATPKQFLVLIKN